MNVAIFYDAEAVAGDPELLRATKRELIEAMSGEPLQLAHFASAVDAFPSPIGLFNNLITSKDQGDALDLKKGGIFPIVHGVRSLAIEHRLLETGTAARIERLAGGRRVHGGIRARIDAGPALSDDAAARRATRRSGVGQLG